MLCTCYVCLLCKFEHLNQTRPISKDLTHPNLLDTFKNSKAPTQKHHHKNAKTPPLNHSSTTPYNRVLLQYYNVLLRTTKSTPVLLRTSPYYQVLQSTTPVLQSTTPVLLQY